VAGPENISLPIRAGSRSYRQGQLWGRTGLFFLRVVGGAVNQTSADRGTLESYDSHPEWASEIGSSALAISACISKSTA
jgi:hypothetical protein